MDPGGVRERPHWGPQRQYARTQSPVKPAPGMTIFRDVLFSLSFALGTVCRRQIRVGARGLVKIGVNPLKRGTTLRQLRSSSTGPTGVTDRAKARECEQLAKQARDSDIKEQFLDMAKKWRDMADHEEKHPR
jgi:hypothetical protein